jgi:adenylate cyclase
LNGADLIGSALVANVGPNVAGLMAIGMGFAFGAADFKSTTSRWSSLFMICAGLSVLGNVNLLRGVAPADVVWWTGIVPSITTLGIIAASEWILRVRQTIPVSDEITNTKFGDRSLRLAQLFALLYGVISVTHYRERAEYFLGGLDSWDALFQPEFWMFASPLEFSVCFAGVGALITLRRKPDIVEVRRLVGFCLAAPLLAIGLVLPMALGAYTFAGGLIVLLIANIQFHVLHAQRGAFMKRFLPPQVAGLVGRQGLENTIETREAEITVVACDLRRFTAFAEENHSALILSTLNEYYDVVGEQAAAAGATIKDYAGDGVLMLLGAPLEIEARAEKALELSQAIRHNVTAMLLAVNAANNADLGIGVGVASGLASVGVVGRQRLEYVAVGSVVNRASRLCDKANDGEVLLDDATRSLLADQDIYYSQLREATVGEVKGMTGVVAWQLQAGLRV